MKKIVVLFLFVANLFSCGWSPPSWAYLHEGYFDFLPKSLLKVDVSNPLYNHSYISSEAYEKRKSYYMAIKKKLNLKEWSQTLKLPTKVVEDALYHDKDIAFKDEEFVNYLKYLQLYKKAFLDKWGYYKIPKDVNQTIIKITMEAYLEADSAFFKLRYAYNLARIYHFFGKYDKELEFIASLEPLKKQDSIVWEWIESLKAGALQHKGDFVNSAYLFAKVFSTHKSDAYIGYYDFRIKTDKQWQELMQKAKDNNQRALFYFLRGVREGNYLLGEYEQMLKLNTTSKWIDITEWMLAQKAQYKVFHLQRMIADSISIDKEYEKNTKIFIKKYLGLLNSKQKKDEFDNYLVEYLEIFNSNKTPTYHDSRYNSLLKFVWYMNSLKKKDEKEIEKVIKDVMITSPNIKNSVEKYTLSKLVYPTGSIKELLVLSADELSLFEINKALNLKSLKEYDKLLAKSNKNYIEKLLLKRADVYLSKDVKNLYYSLFYTGSGEFQKALKFLKKVPKKLQRFGNFNPFNVYFDGNNYKNRTSTNPYPHKKFLETMLKIEEKEGAMDFFLRANGWYNISYFGNSAMLSMPYRSTVAIPPSVHQTELYKLKKAKEFYQKALSLSDNKEFKAKITYQMMKVALAKAMIQNTEYFKYMFEGYSKGEIFKLIDKSDEYKNLYHDMQKLKNTKYYQKIKNCASFKYFR